MAEEASVEYQRVLDTVYAKAAPLVGCGEVTTSIPALTTVDASRPGLALATIDGDVYGAGDWQIPFSIRGTRSSTPARWWSRTD
jgi:glutaminase